MNPYDAVISAMKTLIAESGHQLGPVIVLTEKNLPAEKNLPLMRELAERHHEDLSLSLAKRIRNEVAGAGERFHILKIKFPGIDAYEIPLDDLGRFARTRVST